ncbi:MAG: hypothetical protein E7051_05800 [Lentisphaerae bacterium]|nr:hypothetical protein [Lentisphaerota bacterium]
MKKVLFLIAMAALTLTADEIKFNWKGKAEKIAAPKVEEIKDEDWVSYRCTPTAKGPWQGMIGTSSVKVDLNKFKGVSFDIKQKCYPGNCATVIYFHTSNGNYYTTFNAGNGKDWQHIEIPFDVKKWQGAKSFEGTLTRVVIYPFQSLNDPSKYMEIANFELIEKE